MRAGLYIVNDQLANAEYVAGARFSVADITLVHTLLGMPGELGVKAPDDCLHLRRWLNMIAQRPSIVQTQPPDYGLIQGVKIGR